MPCMACQIFSAVINFVMQLGGAIGAGLALGYVGGRLIVATLNKYVLPAGLHPWLALAGAVALFALTNLIGGSGYLAVYLAGQSERFGYDVLTAGPVAGMTIRF